MGRDLGHVLTVTIVEDDRTTREALVLLLDGAPGFKCVGAYRSAEKALEAGGPAMADVLLVDVGLPGLSGSESVPLLRQRYPDAEVLMLTAFADEEKVFESICNGAVGYLLKTTPAPRLLAAIRDAAAGGAPMSPEIARKVVGYLQRSAPRVASAPASSLTPQEVRVLQLLADGHSYTAVAEQLAISVNTVRTHIRSVYEKLHVSTRSGAVSQGLRRGLIR